MTRFAEAARSLAGVAGALLGWRPDEFWRATPAELAAVLQAMADEEREALDLASLIKQFPDEEGPPPLAPCASRPSPTGRGESDG